MSTVLNIKRNNRRCSSVRANKKGVDQLQLRIFIVVILLLLAGCKENKVEPIEFHNTQHVAYLNHYGWNIGRFASETKYAPSTLQDYKEHTNTIRIEGNIDLTPFRDKEVIETGYILKEKTDHYNQIVGYILESGDEIIGGYLEFNNEVEQINGELQVEVGKTKPMFNSNEINQQPSNLGQILNQDN